MFIDLIFFSEIRRSEGDRLWKVRFSWAHRLPILSYLLNSRSTAALWEISYYHVSSSLVFSG